MKLKENEQLNDEKRQEIKTKIKIGCTPRHVPRYIYTVSDIPYTRSGKKMEIVVSNIINKNKKVNSEGCANPISLKEYENLKI